MPTYTVQINVNVPGLGDRNVVQTGVVAASIEAAVTQAKANVIVTALAAQQTAP
jgi:hypothetical protein